METKKWSIDPMHSDIQFSIKHLMINTVNGKFKTFSGTMENLKDDFTDAKVHFTADVASIDTGVADRDKHLKSDDFFNTEKYPQLQFNSTSIEKVAEDHYKMKGDITIRETTKPIELEVFYGGRMTDFYGNTKAGYTVTGKLHRKQFGLKWDAVTEAGGVVVSDEIKLHLNVQMQLVAGEKAKETEGQAAA